MAMFGRYSGISSQQEDDRVIFSEKRIRELEAREKELTEGLAKAATRISELDLAIKRLQSPPLQHATILRVDREHGTVTVAADGRNLDLALPDANADSYKVGISVAVKPDTTQIVSIVPPVQAGEVHIIRAIKDGVVEVDAAGGIPKVVLVAADVAPLEEGDRVLLDPSGTVVTKSLGKPPTRYSFEGTTGVTWGDIGGLEDAKAEMIEAIELPHLHADLYEKYGKRRIKGVLLYGPPGCVDGDAEVMINRAGKGFRLSLRELVRRFNTNGSFSTSQRRSSWRHADDGAGRCVDCRQKWPCAKTRRRASGPGGRSVAWDPRIPTMIRCFINGEFRLRQVVAAYDRGSKPVLRVTLADGKVLRVTPDHKIAQPGGHWTRADELVAGSRVLVNGQAAPTTGGRYLSGGYWTLSDAALAKHPHARRHDGVYRMAEHRLVAEAALNGLSLDAWLTVIRSEVLDGYQFIDPKLDVHHDDEDPTNNTPDNLVVLTKSEHSKRHRRHRTLPVFLARVVEVISVESDGEAEVFDITVNEASNFVANGILVRNCGKTMLGKATATSLAKIHGEQATGGFIYVKGPEILNRFVGNSEEAIRSMFERSREHKRQTGSPAVIFVDEAESILCKRGNDITTHIERTIVPMFLAEMDGLEDSGAVVLLATNRPDILDPAVVRDGRIDRKIKVTRPTRESAADIFRLCWRGKPTATSVDTLVRVGVEELFSAKRTLYTVERKGRHYTNFTLGDVVNGAMVAGVVDRATSLALRRDIADKTAKGVGRADVVQAVDNTFHQSRDLGYQEEIAEFVREFADEVTGVKRASTAV